jgi:hypothetical protein
MSENWPHMIVFLVVYLYGVLMVMSYLKDCYGYDQFGSG